MNGEWFDFKNMSMSRVFANVDSSEEGIYLPVINKIMQEQHKDHKLKKYFRTVINKKD